MMRTHDSRVGRPGAHSLLMCVCAIVACLCLTSPQAHAYPRPELSRLVYAADTGAQYAQAWLNSNARCFDYPTTTALARLVADFTAAHAAMLPADIELVSYTVTTNTEYYTNGYAMGRSAFPGMRSTVTRLNVDTGVQLKTDSNVYVRTIHALDVRKFSVNEYAMLANGDITILTDEGLNIQGPVHCDGTLSLGQDGGQKLDLEHFVTCASNIICITAGNTVEIHNSTDVNRPMLDAFGSKLDSSHPLWKTQSQSVWGGRVKSAVHGVATLSLPMNGIQYNPRLLIDPPPSTNEHPQVASMRYANRCAVRIINNDVQHYVHASNGFVTIARIGDAAVSTWLTTNWFWNNSINGFVNPLNIDVAVFTTWARGNTSNAFFADRDRSGILYVFHTNRAVRLRNASSVPTPVIDGVTNGFVMATGNPLYLWGNYNNISQVPACCLADSVTVLSVNWNDSNHVLSNSPPGVVMSSTEYITSLITGLSSNYYGGTNLYGASVFLPKYIESWMGVGASGSKAIRGSLLSLWTARYETRNMLNPDNFPFRIWWHDPNYRAPAALPHFTEAAPATAVVTTNRF